MQKLTKKDIKILGEGQLFRKAILEAYDSIEDFYDIKNITIAKKSFFTYLYRQIIHSDTFKLVLVKALDRDYYDIIKSDIEQIRSLGGRMI